jgi:DNA mismatch repair protein MutS2
VELLPQTPEPLAETGGKSLQWQDVRHQLAAQAQSALGREWVLALEPSSQAAWIQLQQQRNDEMRLLLTAQSPFNFRGIFDVAPALDQARIDGAALDALELRSLMLHAERVEAWRQLVSAPPDSLRNRWPATEELSAPLLGHDLGNLLRSLRGKIEPDGSLADDASPELARIRRALERQHRVIQDSLRRALARLSEDGSAQDALITVRGERFVIPVKTEFKRKVGGVIHGSSSTGQTVFVEPMETIEHNNELTRLLDEEQSEIHRILVAMTRAVAAHAHPLRLGAALLAEADAHQAIAHFAQQLNCVRPSFSDEPSPWPDVEAPFHLEAARHPLLDLHLRASNASIVPLTLILPEDKRQLIISGPNTGGKTVALKTAGLLALMAQAGLPVPAERARLPLFRAV